LADVLRWQRTRVRKPWPARREQNQAVSLPWQLAAGELAITFVNHVTFLLQFAGLSLLTDPVYSQRASPVQWLGPRRRHAPGIAFERLPRLDAVFISHNHYDHLDLPTGAWLSQGSRSIYFCGDSGYGPLFGELRQRCGSPDIALLPIGAYAPRWFMHDQHMDPAEAVQVHRTLGAKLSVGCHFGCFPLADEGIDDPLVELASAQAALGVSRSEFLTLAPGETLLWRGASRSLHVTAGSLADRTSA
jgi:L-ascorbate metabolism protein UlaG (beta-lactamase superfamily)